MTMHPGQKEIEQLVYRELANEPMTAEDMELKKHITVSYTHLNWQSSVLQASRIRKRTVRNGISSIWKSWPSRETRRQPMKWGSYANTVRLPESRI